MKRDVSATRSPENCITLWPGSKEVRHERDESAAQLGRSAAGLEQATRERDELAAEIGRLATEIEEIRRDRDRVAANRDQLKFALTNPFPTELTEPDNASLLSTPTGETQSLESAVDDTKIIERIIAAYKLAIAAAAPPSDLFWEQSYVDLKRDVHEALVERDHATVRDLLRDPRKTDLLYGFENLARSLMRRKDRNGLERGLSAYFDLLLLSVVIGAHRLWNPEYLAGNPDYAESSPDVETLLKCIDEHIGFRVIFPNPFPGEIGLPTSRGVASFRAVQSLYQAWLVAGLVGGTRARVVEIGAGTGRTAFYARQLGITDYTMINLPMANVAQANFLARVLGEETVALFGEKKNRSQIRILPSTAFFRSNDKYDLAVTTLDTARSYCLEIKNRAPKLLSINHEYNSFTVRNLCYEIGFPQGTRHPYWMRRGYVEELFNL
jgi:hypothetical protein